jgi:hypothetical protein
MASRVEKSCRHFSYSLPLANDDEFSKREGSKIDFPFDRQTEQHDAEQEKGS